MENPTDTFYKEIGKRIFKAREAKGFTQQQLADKISLKRTSVTNIEKGKQKILIHTLAIIASKLDVDIESLIPKIELIQNEELTEKYPQKSISWVESALSQIEKES